MEKKDNEGFNIIVNSPGNFFAKEMTVTGNSFNYGSGLAASNGFSDEQIARALEAIVGKGKAIDTKQKWAGAYWYLRWAANFPVDTQKFCERIAGMKFARELEYACDYRNIRELATLSFIEQDPRQMELVKPSKNDERVFSQCREVALRLAEALGKTYLPDV